MFLHSFLPKKCRTRFLSRRFLLSFLHRGKKEETPPESRAVFTLLSGGISFCHKLKTCLHYGGAVFFHLLRALFTARPQFCYSAVHFLSRICYIAISRSFSFPIHVHSFRAHSAIVHGERRTFCFSLPSIFIFDSMGRVCIRVILLPHSCKSTNRFSC